MKNYLCYQIEGESDMNEFERVRLRPEIYLYRNFFCDIFQISMFELLGTYAFSELKISTTEEQNKVVFKAAGRKHFDADNDTSYFFSVISKMSIRADFSIEYLDGSFREIAVKDAVVYDKNLFPVRTDTMTRFECSFELPDEYPVNKNFALSTIHKFAHVFPHSHITFNGFEYIGKTETKNKISWFLHHRSFDKNAAKIFEFNGREDNYSWEISFSFDSMAKDNSFINGVKTDFGGPHVGMVKKCIRHILQKISGEKSISLKKLNLALSFHVPPEEIIIQGGLVSLNDFNELVSTPSELHLISKEFSRQLTAYFTANPNELYEILKKCK